MRQRHRCSSSPGRSPEDCLLDDRGSDVPPVICWRSRGQCQALVHIEAEECEHTVAMANVLASTKPGSLIATHLRRWQDQRVGAIGRLAQDIHAYPGGQPQRCIAPISCAGNPISPRIGFRMGCNKYDATGLPFQLYYGSGEPGIAGVQTRAVPSSFPIPGLKPKRPRMMASTTAPCGLLNWPSPDP